MRFKFKKALALLSAAAMCGGMALSYPDGAFSLDVFASTEGNETTPDGNWTDYASDASFGSNSSATYEIGTAEDFAAFAKAVNVDSTSYTYWKGTVKLTADIDLSGHYWLPIGDNNSYFEGTFDGQGYTISNMTIDTEGLYYVGLFGKNHGTIKNVNIDSSCSVTGKAVDNKAFYMGAICGYNILGTIENCSNAGDVTGEDVGGICGRNSSTITNCYNTGDVDGTEDVGGISGFNSSGKIVNCYNTGEVICNSSYTDEISMNGALGNNYYLADSDDGNGGKTAEQFASGEVAYLLSQGCTLSYFNYNYEEYVTEFFSGEGWGQNLKTDDSDTEYDAYPVISDDVVYAGYETSYCGNTEADRIYSNTQFAISSIPEHESWENGSCTTCSTICTHESYKNGECDVCDVVCSHDSYTNGECDVCDIVCTHESYKNGECDVCDVICSHDSYTNGDCDECDVICSHESYTNGICDECESYEDGVGAKLAGYSLSLEGNIGVNFYMELDDSVIADTEAYMQFTLGGEEFSQIKVSDAVVDTETVEGKTYYVFKCEVPAKDMDTAITAQIVLSDGTKGTEYEYTVKEYADYILDEENGYNEVTRNLVNSMLSYGDYAEAYFNDTGLAATEAMNAVTADTLAEYACSVTDENSLYYGSSLLLKSDTIIRHYFTEEVAGSTQKGNLWYIDTESIAAHNLGSAITTEADGITISYSPLSYAYKALSSDTTSDSLKNLAKAMYLYYQAADAYVNYVEVYDITFNIYSESDVTAITANGTEISSGSTIQVEEGGSLTISGSLEAYYVCYIYVDNEEKYYTAADTFEYTLDNINGDHTVEISIYYYY